MQRDPLPVLIAHRSSIAPDGRLLHAQLLVLVALAHGTPHPRIVWSALRENDVRVCVKGLERLRYIAHKDWGLQFRAFRAAPFRGTVPLHTTLIVRPEMESEDRFMQ